MTAVVDAAPQREATLSQVPGARPRRLHLACLVLALGLWLLSLPAVDVQDLSGAGLISALPPLWWVALCLAVGGQVVGLFRRELGRGLFWAYQALVVALLFATTSAVYAYPRYPWTYKHVGVVEQLLSTGFLTSWSLDRSIDIYHNWPGFFVVASAVSAVLHVPPLAVAQWAEPVFALLTAVAVAYAVRALTSDVLRLRLAVVLFTLGNWIGSNYYSPQAFAMVVALLFLGVVLRTLPVRGADGALVPRRLVARALRGRASVRLAPDLPGRLTSRPALGWLLATVLWTLLVVSHQLTPVAVMLQVGALWLLFALRPYWLLLVWVAIEAAWVLSARKYLSGRFTLLQTDALSSFTWPGTQLTPSLPGMTLVGLCGPLLQVGLPLLAFVVWLGTRGRTSQLVPLMLGFGPATLIAVQSYGGEVVFRAYLYGLPWYALLIAPFLVRLWDAGSWRRVLLLVSAAALTAVVTAADFGQELVNHVAPADVVASRWYETNTPPGSQAVGITGLGFPLQLTAAYPGHLSTRPPLSVLSGQPPLAHGPGAALDAVVDDLYRGGYTTGYVVLDRSQRTYARMYGVASPGQLDDFVETVRTSPTWEVVYDADDVLIAHYRG